jgi:hypothetical protein
MVIVSCILLVEMLVMGSAIDVKNNVFFVWKSLCVHRKLCAWKVCMCNSWI